MMMVKTIPAALGISFALLLNGAHAQTVAEERVKIEQYGKQITSLEKSNANIEQELAGLDKQIARVEGKNGPEKKTFQKAEARYQQAVKLAEDRPTTSNLEKAETARFEYVMAERKYQRSTQGVTTLKKQQAKLQAGLVANEKKIRKANTGIARQQKQILALEQQAREQADQEAQSERQLRLQGEGALRNSRDELSKARENHAAAVAEITTLKAMLAEKEAAASAAAASKAITVANLQAPQSAQAVTATDASDAVPPPVKTSPAPTEITQPASRSPLSSKEQYLELHGISAQQQGSKHRVNKIIHVKTYSKGRLSKQTSHSLKHLGNGIYEGKTRVRAGTTSFIVGGKQWRETIPESDNKRDYIFVLDARNKARMKLLLFARSDLD